ncbi:MAG: response regulator transcription factor [Proteobacteria bacterium]|nr:response regulator transcription factor [Pseudomonadota bacterium]
MNILVVEDQQRLGQFLTSGLKEHAYEVRWVRSCAAASDALSEHRYSAIVLDLGLPDGDGLELLSQWRRAGFQEPVLILSARDTVQDRISGLNVGADDYLPKPFSFEELLARLRSLLRRQSTVKSVVLEHHGIALDTVNRTVHVGGQPVELTSRELAVLEIFMHNAGRIVTRSLICETIWSSSVDSDANLLDVYISRLRGKLEAVRGQPLFKTLRGVGYQLL